MFFGLDNSRIYRISSNKRRGVYPFGVKNIPGVNLRVGVEASTHYSRPGVYSTIRFFAQPAFDTGLYSRRAFIPPTTVASVPGEQTSAQNVVGSIGVSLPEKPMSREMSARCNALHSDCPRT